MEQYERYLEIQGSESVVVDFFLGFLRDFYLILFVALSYQVRSGVVLDKHALRCKAGLLTQKVTICLDYLHVAVMIYNDNDNLAQDRNPVSGL